MTPNIVLPNGQSLEEFKKYQQDPQGKGLAYGMTTWNNRNYNASGSSVQGTTPKKGNWRDYYDMYKTHSLIRAAIDKTAKTATNVGYDFVPRDSRSTAKESEIKILQDFFYKQTDFIGELRRIYKDMMIYGDAYLYVVPDRRRRPVRLKRLHPKTITLKVKDNGEIVAYYQHDPDNPSGPTRRFEPQEMLHFKIDDPDNDIYGLSPLESLKLAVTADLYAQRYNASFFKNSGVSGTIIGIRNANPDEIQRNRKWLQENYTGPESAHKPIIIEGESVDIQKSVATHTEMNFLEGRKFIILEILAVLDVPPAKLGIMESANRSNAKEQDKSFRTEAISPLQNIVESVINDNFVRKILGVKLTKFVHAEGDTRDQIEQMNYYTKGQAYGNFSINEVRSVLGKGPVEGGDINFIMTPTGAVPVDRMNLYFQLPQQNTDTVPSVNADPPQGEAPPKRQPLPTTGSSRTVAKSFNPAVSLHAAVVLLQQQQIDDSHLRKAYTLLADVMDLDKRDEVAHAFSCVQKSLLTQDAILKIGYIERARDYLVDTVLQAQVLKDLWDPMEYLNDTEEED